MPAKKQSMDVSRPGKTVPSATARPIIVGHSNMIKDPMMSNASADQAPAQVADITPTPRVSSKVIKPIVDTEVADAEFPATETQSAPKAGGKTQSVESRSVAPETNQAVVDQAPTETTGSEEAETVQPASESADIVEAVVEQSASAKKDSSIDQALVERQEKVSKLISDKTYFVPIKPPRRTRNTRVVAGLLALVLVLLAAGYAAVDAEYLKPGFDVPVHFLRKTKSESNAVPTPTPVAVVTPPTTTTANGITAYSNKEYGVSFSYPAGWGEVSVTKKAGSISGNNVLMTFSKQPLMRIGMLSKDYKEQGRDGTCRVLLGVFPTTTLADQKTFYKEGERSTDADYKQITKILKNTEELYVYENFEAGTPDALGTCLGLTAHGYKVFTSGAYTGVQLFWGTAEQPTIPVSDFTKYKSNTDSYFSATDRAAFLAVVESVKQP